MQGCAPPPPPLNFILQSGITRPLDQTACAVHDPVMYTRLTPLQRFEAKFMEVGKWIYGLLIALLVHEGL